MKIALYISVIAAIAFAVLYFMKQSQYNAYVAAAQANEANMMKENVNTQYV